MRHKRLVPLCVAPFSMSACGGGDGGNTGVMPPPPRTPQSVPITAEEPNLQQAHLFSASDEARALLQLTPAFANANGDVLQFAVSPDRRKIRLHFPLGLVRYQKNASASSWFSSRWAKPRRFPA